MSNIKYRKDIDGLRAFAVISVILFHLDLSWVKSGFLGVDIFFVISGYLITTIILRDLEQGIFSIKNFYLRRIRRILPALIVVSIFTSFFAWLFLLPQDLINYSWSLVSALGSFSNLFFFKTLNFGYFSTDSSIIPLLHTWSLGIEEQFYIVWPIILILLFKLKLSSKKSLVIITVILTIASISFFFWKHFPKFYYIPMARGFELLFGCVLAILLNNRKAILHNKFVLNTLSLISFFMMAIPCYFVVVPYPSVWTLVACLGATIFIFSGSQGTIPVFNKVLSFKPIVAIGVISYSLYLWHWPIIAYINYLSLNKTPVVCLIIFTASAILATLSYFFVEKPFRHKIKFNLTKSVIYLWIIPIIIACLFALCSKNQHFGFNHPNINQNKLTFKYGFEKVDKNGCFYNFDVGDNADINNPYYSVYREKYSENLCKIHPNQKSTILLLGNSHARADWPMVVEWVKNMGKNATLLSITRNNPQNKYSYTPYPKKLGDHTGNTIMDQRFDFVKKIIKKDSNYKTIILANLFGIGTNNFNIFGKIAKDALDNGKNIVLIIDNPYLGYPAPNFLPNTNISNLCAINRIHTRCSVLAPIYRKWLNPQIIMYKKLQKLYPKQVFIVDPNKVICNDTKCKTSIDGIPIFADSNHLNYLGSQLLGKSYIKKYGNPLTKIVN
ncbi:acyltransferase [Francisella sp. Scap27]|uniref:acyltransferase family protein n=1 Tax=Francisella sp. Scap27 TaxID=2589986 RepID=UPI0015C05E57|nr:acyltransferase family protein [Francisella sp. Scap27]QLE79164.1 acyltransferase [Francisella sp. Scap27]